MTMTQAQNRGVPRVCTSAKEKCAEQFVTYRSNLQKENGDKYIATRMSNVTQCSSSACCGAG